MYPAAAVRVQCRARCALTRGPEERAVTYSSTKAPPYALVARPVGATTHLALPENCVRLFPDFPATLPAFDWKRVGMMDGSGRLSARKKGCPV